MANKKIIEIKKDIKNEKEKIRNNKKKIRKIKRENFNNTKFGKFLEKINFIKGNEDDCYTSSSLLVCFIVSFILGAMCCFTVFLLLCNGRNYFKISKNLGKFFDTYQIITNKYYGEVELDSLEEAAINGILESVGDNYTIYANSDAAAEFDESVSGVYEGIGCTISQNDDSIFVVSVYDDSPASKAGLKEGDIIVSVDSKDSMEYGLNGLSDYIKNNSNNEVNMVILRDGEEQNLTLKKGNVELPVVVSKTFEDNDSKVGYIGISLFTSVSFKQFKKELDLLEKEKIDSLIIDVRSNNGGYLSSVEDILSYLLPKGKVLYQTQSSSKKKKVKDKTKDMRSYPIAVLVNSGSASASEVLASCIKESYGGMIIGTKTFGKGTVQQVKKLSDGSMIKYTTENWLTPDGNWINETGIEPTVLVEMDKTYYENPSDETDNQLQKALEMLRK